MSPRSGGRGVGVASDPPARTFTAAKGLKADPTRSCVTSSGFSSDSSSSWVTRMRRISSSRLPNSMTATSANGAPAHRWLSSLEAHAVVHRRFTAAAHASHSSTPSFRAVRTALKPPVHTLVAPTITCEGGGGGGALG